MLLSDPIAEARKSAIYFGMLNQSPFSSIFVFEFSFVPFPELIVRLEIPSLGASLQKVFFLCVCVHSCTLVHVCVIYTHMTLHRLLSS